MLISTALLLSVGQVLFKITANQLEAAGPLTIYSLFNPVLISALVLYGFATVLWVLSLRGVSLRQAYPFAGIAFAVVPIFSHFVLGEPLKINTFVGSALIVMGITVSVL